MKSYKYCVASDIIRLLLLNITGGIYFDIDTQVIGEVGEIKSKYGYNILYYHDKDGELDFGGNFRRFIGQYLYEIENILT